MQSRCWDMLGYVGGVGNFVPPQEALGSFPMLGYVGMCWGCGGFWVHFQWPLGLSQCWDMLGMLGYSVSPPVVDGGLSQCWDMLGCVGDVGLLCFVFFGR